jgi:hypothetical protein
VETPLLGAAGKKFFCRRRYHPGCPCGAEQSGRTWVQQWEQLSGHRWANPWVHRWVGGRCSHFILRALTSSGTREHVVPGPIDSPATCS